MTHQPVRTRLPTIEPTRAALQTAVLLRLAREPGLTAALAAVPRTVIGFATDAGAFEISPPLSDGAVPLLVADDGAPDAVAAVAALAALEPLVADLERALGVALRPTGVGPPACTLWLRIEARDVDGQVGHAALLGIADDVALAPAMAVTPDFAPRLRARFDFAATGPALAPSRIAALGSGDVVLLGGTALSGQLRFGGIARAAMYRPADAALTIVEPEGTSPVSEPESALDPELRLPLTVEIGGGTATLGELSGLVAGSVVPLGIVGATLACSLAVGGSVVAHGELVAIGDAYGVLITRRVAD